MRPRAQGDDESLEALLVELRASTAQALEAMDRTLAKSLERESKQEEREADARRRALDELEDIDPQAFARLLAELLEDPSRVPDDLRRELVSVLGAHLERLLEARGVTDEAIEEDFRALRRARR